MASRKWVAEDGAQFDHKAEVVEYESRTPHINNLKELFNLDDSKAKDVLDYFERSFRVSKKRGPRKPPVVQPPSPVPDSATAATAKVKGK